MTVRKSRIGALRRGAVVVVAVAAAGCAAGPGGWPPGTPIDTARRAVFGPTAEYPLPDGGTRLEFTRGEFGKETEMVDFDTAGRLASSQHVRTAPYLATISPGMTDAEVRMRFGRPVQVFPVPWQRLHVWNYRFIGGDCVWYQVSISDATHRVTEAGQGTDPICDGPNDRSR